MHFHASDFVTESQVCQVSVGLRGLGRRGGDQLRLARGRHAVALSAALLLHVVSLVDDHNDGGSLVESCGIPESHLCRFWSGALADLPILKCEGRSSAALLYSTSQWISFYVTK